MKSELRLFRPFLALTLFTSIGADYLSRIVVENDQSGLFDWVGHGALLPHEAYDVLYAIGFAAYYGGIIALFLFWGFGRWLFLLSLLLTIPTGFLGGYLVITPAESGVYAILGIMNAFVLGMAFFSPPVLARFRSNQRLATARGPMKTLREFTDPTRAGVLQSFLKDHEIDAVLLDEGASAWTAGRLLVPVRLAVPVGQAQAAMDLLNQFERN